MFGIVLYASITIPFDSENCRGVALEPSHVAPSLYATSEISAYVQLPPSFDFASTRDVRDSFVRVRHYPVQL